MADTKKEATGQEPSTEADKKAAAAKKPAAAKKAAAVKKAAAARPESETKQAAALLTSILNEVQSQVQRQTPTSLAAPPPPLLEGKALEAFFLFRKIVAALGLQPCRTTITLAPSQVTAQNNDSVKITWTSTDAQTVTIHSNKAPAIGPVRADKGEIIVTVTEVPETFTATAAGPCCVTDFSNPVTVSSGSFEPP